MFGDYYWAAANHDAEMASQNGFWLRKIYLTYDKSINTDFDVRLRLELNSAGDFKTKSALTPVVKDAYLKFK